MMTSEDVKQHVQTVQRRMNDRVIQKLDLPGRITPRKRVVLDWFATSEHSWIKTIRREGIVRTLV